MSMSKDLKIHKRRRTIEEDDEQYRSQFWSLPNNMCENFEDMNLKPDLLRGIHDYGLHRPSTAQQLGIVPFCEGADVVLQAVSQLAQTLTYCIGILQRLDPSLHNCQCLVVTVGHGYTREVKADLEALGCYLGVKVHSKEDAHVVVGPSYDLCNLLRTGKVSSRNIKIVIFHGADLLLNQDSRIDLVNTMFGLLPLKVNGGLQVGFVAQTMPEKILDNIMKIVKQPVVLRGYDPDEVLTLDSIKKHQFVFVENEESKTKTLVTLLRKVSVLAIVFVDNPTRVPILVEELLSFDMTVSATRTGMTNKERVEIKKHVLKSRVLITTSLWARGMIDLFHRVPIIINYDGCLFPEEYIGRVGVFREVASSLCFATRNDWVNWIRTQCKYNIFIDNFSPSTFEVETKYITEINVINKERDCKHFVYNVGNEEEKVEELESSLWKHLTVAETSVIFVSCPERVSQLVTIMGKIPECKLHFITDIVRVENTMGPFVFITSDKKFDVQLEVNLVINYDPPSIVEHYYRRLLWCQSNGVVMHFATDMDWVEVLNMQISCSVFLKPLPRVIDFSFLRPAELEMEA